MTVETKFNIGDEVWVLKAEKAVKVRINSLKVTFINEEKTTQEFWLSCGQWWHESSVFKTKGELIESLFN